MAVSYHVGAYNQTQGSWNSHLTNPIPMFRFKVCVTDLTQTQESEEGNGKLDHI